MKRNGLIFLLLAIVYGMNAQIVNVPADHSIQAAIDAAENGDTILVQEGTYTENIRFNGKRITLASLFIIDGDTSHISRTIIDGSEPANQDTASVVLFNNGTDSTTVLCGFTITGGTGTLHINPLFGPRSVAGGIYFDSCGGVIEHNIIRNNNLNSLHICWGAGICAFPATGNSVIIQNNQILYNKIVSSHQDASSGGGIKIGTNNDQVKTTCIVQNNNISYNEVRNIHIAGNAIGGGMNYGMMLPTPPGEFIIRNNIFSYNKVIGGGKYDRGAGFVVIFLHTETEYYEDMRPNPVIYNNIVHNNFSDNYAAGIMTRITLVENNTNYFTLWKPLLINNTVVDNYTSEGPAHPVGFHNEYSAPVLINNIFCNDLGSDENFEVGTWGDYFFEYNNLVQGFVGLPELNNIDCCPDFMPDGYELSDADTCAFGTGVDSLKIEDQWFYAPKQDFNGNPRPNPTDNLVDMGAYEYCSGHFDTDDTVDIKNSYVTNGVSIYPNPVVDFLCIQKHKAGLCAIEIHSLSGQLIYKSEMQGNTHTLDMSAFNKGLYFITIRSKDFVQTEKIIRL
ncbi:T9SS type A sorting domain-containing protein [Bacteroidota bacterium]